MATANIVNQYLETWETFAKLPMEKITRPQLGEASAARELDGPLTTLRSFHELAEPHLNKVASSAVSGARTVIHAVTEVLQTLVELGDSEWLNQKNGVLDNVRKQLTKLEEHRVPFVVAHAEAQGLLNVSEFLSARRKEIEEAEESSLMRTDAARSELEEMIGHASARAAEIEEAAKRTAMEIEEAARQTAQEISMEAAQKEFADEQTDIDDDRRFWWCATTATIIGFFAVVALYYYVPFEAVDDRDNALAPWSFIYSALLRLLVLGVAASFMALSLKMLRAHLHMSRLNKHRQRVANCVEAFVQAGETREARTLILANLVDAVIAFGNSGILAKDEDSIAAQKTGAHLIDSVLKNVQPGQVPPTK